MTWMLFVLCKQRIDCLMWNENGTWIMYGVNWDDLECLHTVDEAIEYINEVLLSLCSAQTLLTGILKLGK